MYEITIVGCGITGMLVLSILDKHKFDLSKVCIIDPYFDGGNLIRLYGTVISNTPLIKTVNALKLIDSEYILPEEYSSYDINKTTPLYIIAQIIKDFTKPLLLQVDKYESNVQSIKYDTTYTIETRSHTIKSRILILCHGATQKTMNCDIPSIPIHIALNKDLLKMYVKPTEHVLLFGTAHSGTLILENLHNLNIKTTAVYKKKDPFLFARDGEYDGIKEEAERIATDILNNTYTNLTLLNINQIDKIIKASKEADYVVYAIGFETNTFIKANFNLHSYDTKTGKIDGLESAYGFGIAYPSGAPDGIHIDVGVAPFVEHIQNQIETIKKIIY